MAKDLGTATLRSVASHWVFDEYWPGATTTSHWKGVISLLTEAASCRLATPIYVEPTELAVRGKGLAEYKKSVNMPDPWPGGWWRLGDIVQYELVSMMSVLETSATHREELLRFRNRLCRKELERGRLESPAYYVLPGRQNDRGALPDLANLLAAHGVAVFEISNRAEVGGMVFEAGTVVVPLAQPFRAFVKEVMEAQHYPVRHYTPDGQVIKPYDITSWSLPLNHGLTYVEIADRSEDLESRLRPLTPGGLDVVRTTEALGLEGGTLPAGSFVMTATPDRLSDIVVSGYAENEELLANRPVIVWLRKGTGQLVLFGFNPQFRASTPATLKLLYNALLVPELTDSGDDKSKTATVNLRPE